MEVCSKKLEKKGCGVQSKSVIVFRAKQSIVNMELLYGVLCEEMKHARTSGAAGGDDQR